jgi:hypothetical protein
VTNTFMGIFSAGFAFLAIGYTNVGFAETLGEAIVRQGANGKIAAYVGEECAVDLIDFYKSRGSLNVKDITTWKHKDGSPAVISVGKFKKTFGSENQYFYHYTPSEAYPDGFSAKKNTAELPEISHILDTSRPYFNMMSKIRDADDTFSSKFGYGSQNYPSEAGGVLYVSSNPYSSAFFGDSLVAFKFSEEALVLDMTGYVTENNLTKPRYDVFFNRKEFRLRAFLKSKRLNRCSIMDVIFFVLEDSGIDLIYYSSEYTRDQLANFTCPFQDFNSVGLCQSKGVLSEKWQSVLDAGYSPGQALGWYQLLSGKNILSHEYFVLKYEKEPIITVPIEELNLLLEKAKASHHIIESR